MKTVSVDKTDSDNPNCFPRSTNPELRARSTLRIGKSESPDTWPASPKSELKQHTRAQRSVPSKWPSSFQKMAGQALSCYQLCTLSNSHYPSSNSKQVSIRFILYACFFFLSTPILIKIHLQRKQLPPGFHFLVAVMLTWFDQFVFWVKKCPVSVLCHFVSKTYFRGFQAPFRIVKRPVFTAFLGWHINRPVSLSGTIRHLG